MMQSQRFLTSAEMVDQNPSWMSWHASFVTSVDMRVGLAMNIVYPKVYIII